MAYSQKPSDWFANYSLGSSQAKFNTSTNGSPTLSEVSDTTANATTGDVRQLLWAILNHAYTYYLGLAGADRPQKMVMNRTTSEDANGNVNRTISVTWIMDETMTNTVDSE